MTAAVGTKAAAAAACTNPIEPPQTSRAKSHCRARLPSPENSNTTRRAKQSVPKISSDPPIPATVCTKFSYTFNNNKKIQVTWIPVTRAENQPHKTVRYLGRVCYNSITDKSNTKLNSKKNLILCKLVLITFYTCTYQFCKPQTSL